MAEEESPIFQQRQILHAAIGEAFDDAVIGGWVLLYETLRSDPDVEGRTMYNLEIASSDATGEQDLRPWTQRGWLLAVGHDQEYFEYPEAEEDDEA